MADVATRLSPVCVVGLHGRTTCRWLLPSPHAAEQVVAVDELVLEDESDVDQQSREEGQLGSDVYAQ